ncbi:MAG: hypothetical protein B7Y32_00695 [Methylophilales bacterium 16-45-7]|nr:MAG: hypothetical protein B7Y32_00695 [Methylophilales bacterium 16-45-7]
MTTYTPISHLMSQGRPDVYPVCSRLDATISWLDFSTRVKALAYGLQLRAENRWLVSSPDAIEFSVQVLALWHAGKQVVIPPNMQAGTLKDLASEYDAIVSNDMATLACDSFVFTPLISQATFIDLYTSGSTGRPKRIRKTLAQFESEIDILEALWGNKLGDCAIVATVPHHHIYGFIFRVLWPLSAGRVMDNVLCTDPEMLKNRLSAFKNAAIVSSPALLSRLPELAPLVSIISGTCTIFSSGGPLSKVAAFAFDQQLGYSPIEVYGSTETGGIAWRKQLIDEAWTPFVGVKLANIEGTATLASPFLADALPKVIDDAIELLSDGCFHLLGRIDRIVKIEEKRLSLPDMESLLLKHSWIKAAAAVALASRKQSVGVAIELTKEGQSILAQHGRRHVIQLLKVYLAQYFDKVLLPRYWRFVKQLPMSAQGKLTSAAVHALFSPEDNHHAVT